MVVLGYGSVWTTVENAEEGELETLRSALSFFDTKINYATGEREFMVFYDRLHKRFPSGFLSRVVAALEKEDVRVKVNDFPEYDDVTGIECPDDLLVGKILYPAYQVPALVKMIYWRRGVVKFPTSSGKTLTSAGVVAYLERFKGLRSVMLVPGKASLDQTHAEWTSVGLDVGRLGGGRSDLDHTHIIAIVNSALLQITKRNKRWLSILEKCGALHLMEAHHAPAKQWVSVAEACPASYRYGYSATPFESYGDAEALRDQRLVGMTGPVIATIRDSLLMNMGQMATPIVHLVRTPGRWSGVLNYHMVETKLIVGNELRNELIADIVVRLILGGKKIFVYVSKVEHGRDLARRISTKLMGEPYPVILYRGQGNKEDYLEGLLIEKSKISVVELTRELEAAEDGCVLVGSPAVEEDADLRPLNVLVNAAGGKSYKGVIQRAGRVLRPKPPPNTVDLVDFQDNYNPVLKKHSRLRETSYREKYRGAEGMKVLRHDTYRSAVRHIVEGCVDRVSA